MPFTVGTIPYLNGAPLVLPLQRLGAESPVAFVSTVPSELPPLLEAGDVDAILVSSIDSLRTPGRKIAGGVCVGSRGDVDSVRLFSKKPFDRIESLAEDQSSMTSNALAKIVLADAFGVSPTTRRLPPNLAAMLDEADACVLIGDIGMSSDGTGLYVLDLGRAWKELTGLPFVWAMWVGKERLTPELAGWLNWARRVSGCGADTEGEADEELIAMAANASGMPLPRVASYLTRTISYRLDKTLVNGLREYQNRLLAHGIIDSRTFPEIVQPTDVD